MKNNTNNAPSNASSQAKPMGRFEKLFSNRWFAMAVSAMLAVLLWLVVIAQEPTHTPLLCPVFPMITIQLCIPVRLWTL